MTTLADRLNEHTTNAYELLGEINRQLEAIRENTLSQLDDDTLLYKTQMAQATSATQDLILQAPNGVDWMVERFSVTSSAGAAVDFYLDEVQPQNLVEVQPTAVKNAWPASKGVLVPNGRVFIAHFTGLAGNPLCTVNYRIREVDPTYNRARQGTLR